MRLWWSLVFGVTMLACFLLVVVAACVPSLKWWLPDPVSTHAHHIDALFYLILAVTGFFFVLTEALLVWFMYRYGAGDKPATDADFPKLFKPFTKYLDSQHKIELGWTILPAAILLFLAFFQISVWAEAKYASRRGEMFKDATPLQVAVVARQFEWRIRYPSSYRLEQWLKLGKNFEQDEDFKNFAKVKSPEDVESVNELHLWKGHPMLVQLTTADVIHSFNLPHFRVKQDALPGRILQVWFTAKKANMTQLALDSDAKTDSPTDKADDKNRWDLACAELCGWGHYRMVGRVLVHETQDDFMSWLRAKEKEEHGRVSAKK